MDYTNTEAASSSKVVYKFASGEVALRRMLVDRTLRFTPPNELNDPFECGPDTSILTDPLYDEPIKLFGNQALYEGDTLDVLRDVLAFSEREAMLDISSEDFGILSLTATCDHPLLWSHYAGMHQGFAIGFDSDHSFFQRGNGRLLNGLQAVTYTDDRPLLPGILNFNTQPTDEQIAAINTLVFFHKSACWSYEREMRLMAGIRQPAIQKEGLAPGVVHFDAEMVKEIVIGPRTPFKEVETIYNLQSQSYPHASLMVAWPDRKRFGIYIKKAPSIEWMRNLRSNKKA